MHMLMLLYIAIACLFCLLALLSFIGHDSKASGGLAFSAVPWQLSKWKRPVRTFCSKVPEVITNDHLAKCPLKIPTRKKTLGGQRFSLAFSVTRSSLIQLHCQKQGWHSERKENEQPLRTTHWNNL